MTDLSEKRNNRKKISAQIFTPSFLVQDILNKLLECNPKALDEGQTILDPTCGNGNMLIEVLKYRLKAGIQPIQAISTLYGADIMEDDIEEAQLRIINAIKDNLTDDQLTQAISIVCQNLVCVPLSKYPNGSLDYDFEFSQKPTNEDVQKITRRLV